MDSKPKLLFLLSRIPYPLDKGDKLRAYHQLKGLQEYFDIVLVCLNVGKTPSKSLDELRPFCHHIEIIQLSYLGILFRLFKGLFSTLPFQVHFFYSKKGQLQLDRVIEKFTPKRFYCQLIRVTEYATKYTVFNKTLDYMDALSIGMKRRLETAPFYLKPFVSAEYERLKKYENSMFQHFENKIIISDQDKEYIAHQNTDEITVIANGIDTAYWNSKPIEKKFDIVFTGNMAYPPNVEGAQFMVKKVLPILIKKRPNIHLLISGKSPAPAVRALQSSNVTITGWIEDIRNSYNEGHVFFAPMNLGSGLQNKLLEAMSMGIPCVTSKLANKALKAEHENQIMVGDSSKEYAEHVERLLDDHEFAAQLARNGRTYVEQQFDWKYWNKELRNVILAVN